MIYNAQDLFPEAYLASQEVREGWLARAMSRLMNRIYRATDRITVITRVLCGGHCGAGHCAGESGGHPEFRRYHGRHAACRATIPSAGDTPSMTGLW